MAFFLYFILIGVAMYLLDWLQLRLRKGVTAASYLVSGLLVGIISALILHAVYPLTLLGWILVPLVSVSGAVMLFLAFRLDLYSSSLFQIFGTVTLGLATGILAWIVLEILLAVGFIRRAEMLLFRRPFIDLIVYGFLLQFGYAFTGRFVKAWLKKSGGRSGA